jgi:hypothetical protein
VSAFSAAVVQPLVECANQDNLSPSKGCVVHLYAASIFGDRLPYRLVPGPQHYSLIVAAELAD